MIYAASLRMNFHNQKVAKYNFMVHGIKYSFGIRQYLTIFWLVLLQFCTNLNKIVIAVYIIFII